MASKSQDITVKLTTARSGLDGSHASGSELTLPAAEAKRMLENGTAVPVAKRAEQRAETR